MFKATYFDAFALSIRQSNSTRDGLQLSSNLQYLLLAGSANVAHDTSRMVSMLESHLAGYSANLPKYGVGGAVSIKQTVKWFIVLHSHCDFLVHGSVIAADAGSVECPVTTDTKCLPPGLGFG